MTNVKDSLESLFLDEERRRLLASVLAFIIIPLIIWWDMKSGYNFIPSIFTIHVLLTILHLFSTAVIMIFIYERIQERFRS